MAKAVGGGSMEDDRMHQRQIGTTTHQLNAPVWPEEQGSQEGGGHSTDRGVWRKACTESLTKMVAKR